MESIITAVHTRIIENKWSPIFRKKNATFGGPEATQGSFRRPGLREAICG